MKVSKSQIFKSAWKLVKTTGKTISQALKQAWAMSKEIAFSLKQYAIEAIASKLDKTIPSTLIELSIPFADSSSRSLAKKYDFRWNSSAKTWYKQATFIPFQLCSFIVF